MWYFRLKGMIDVEKEPEYCKCEDNPGVHAVCLEFGCQMVCDKCGKPLEDDFHYYDEPDPYNDL